MIQKPTPRIRQPKPLRSKPHVVNRALRDAVLERDEMMCQWCRVLGGALDPHHILPRGRGGQDTLGNLVALHRQCHRYCHEHPAEAKRKGFIA